MSPRHPTTPMRDRIVQAALECMRAHGLRGTTTKVVARAAGVSEGSIYNHFANRSELIVEAFGLATEAIRTRAGRLDQLVGVNTVQENLVTLMDAVIDFFREVLPVVGSVLGEPKLRSSLSSGQIADPDGHPLTPLTGVVELGEYLEREHRAGRIPERPSWRACATMLIGACLHYVYIESLTPAGTTDALPGPGRSARDYAQTVVETLFTEQR